MRLATLFSVISLGSDGLRSSESSRTEDGPTHVIRTNNKRHKILRNYRTPERLDPLRRGRSKSIKDLYCLLNGRSCGNYMFVGQVSGVGLVEKMVWECMVRL